MMDEKNSLFDNIKFIFNTLLLVTAVYFLMTHVITIGLIPSESMYPTLKVGTFVLTQRVSSPGDLDRGDIVSFYEGETSLIKRVIGLPGETIDLINGYVYIDGKRLDEHEYLSATTYTYSGPSEQTHFEVPEGCYFMMGDNRFSSADSRYFDDPYVSKDNVWGKELFAVHIPFLEKLVKA